MVFRMRPRKEEAGTHVGQDERQGLFHKKAQDTRPRMRHRAWEEGPG